MSKENQTSAQQQKSLTVTIFWPTEDQDGNPITDGSFLAYGLGKKLDEETGEEKVASVRLAIEYSDLAKAVVDEARVKKKRYVSSSGNGFVLKFFAFGNEYDRSVNGDLEVYNLHRSKPEFQPFGLALEPKE